MKIIGVAGPAGSGKDTVGDYLVDMLGYQRLPFAGVLKAMLAAAGLPEPTDRALKEQPILGFAFSWREAAQTLGTEWGRSLDQDLWLKLSLLKITEGSNWVITDLRFENEATAIRERGGTIIHLRGRSVDLGERASHASEVPLVVGVSDYFIYNNGSIDMLHEEVDMIMKEVS